MEWRSPLTGQTVAEMIKFFRAESIERRVRPCLGEIVNLAEVKTAWRCFVCGQTARRADREESVLSGNKHTKKSCGEPLMGQTIWPTWKD